MVSICSFVSSARPPNSLYNNKHRWPGQGIEGGSQEQWRGTQSKDFHLGYHCPQFKMKAPPCRSLTIGGGA